jgi:integrase
MSWRDKLKNLDTNMHNKEKIMEFLESRVVNNNSESSLYIYCWCLIPFANFFKDKRFEKLESKDMINYIACLKDTRDITITRTITTKEGKRKEIKMKHRSKINEESLRSQKVSIKTFLKWLNDGITPKCCRDLKVGKFKSRVQSQQQLISIDELKAMINIADHPRDRCLLSVLFDSGGRSGEISKLRIGDVDFEDGGAVIHVNGKTGYRSIPLTFSTYNLKEWINNHPDKENKIAYVFFDLRYRSNKHITQSGINFFVKRMARKAGIEKRIYCHLFRHSCMTELEKEGKLIGLSKHRFAGWSADSRMNSVYSKLSDMDVKNKRWENNRQYTLPKAGKVCKCGFINPLGIAFCEKCKLPLDPVKLAEYEQKKREERLQVAEMRDLMKQMKKIEPLLPLLNEMAGKFLEKKGKN